MKLTSKKARINNFLKKKGFKKSERYPSRIKGYPNVNHGFGFRKWDEETYILYFEKGNFGFRDMSVDECNIKTRDIYLAITKECPLDNISISTGYYYNGVYCIEIR